MEDKSNMADKVGVALSRANFRTAATILKWEHDVF